MPTPAGAISTGYIVYTSYSDYACAATKEVTVTRIGGCYPYSSYYSTMVIDYIPGSSSQSSYYRVAVYYNGNCAGPMAYWSSQYMYGSCSSGGITTYSATMPQLPTAVATM